MMIDVLLRLIPLESLYQGLIPIEKLLCTVIQEQSTHHHSRASQFFQIAKQIKGDVVEVIWVGCSQILFVQAYFWCFNLQYRSM